MKILGNNVTKTDMRVEKCNVQKHVMHNQYYQLKTFHDAANKIGGCKSMIKAP